MKRSVVIREIEKVFKEVPYGIDHALRVMNNAELILKGEVVGKREGEIVFLAALLHDIGAGDVRWKWDLMEGPAIVRGILERAGAEVEVIERVGFLVEHFHRAESLDGIDFQVLWEADILDNLEFGEAARDRERFLSVTDEDSRIFSLIQEHFKTATGQKLALVRCGIGEGEVLFKMPERILLAHRHSSYHRDELERSAVCGCFDCLEIFDVTEIEYWVDQVDHEGQTALCPRCSVDAVIGSASGFPIEREFLEEMQRYWFG